MQDTRHKMHDIRKLHIVYSVVICRHKSLVKCKMHTSGQDLTVKLKAVHDAVVEGGFGLRAGSQLVADAGMV